MIINTTEHGVKISTGSYKGSGTYGANNPNILTFGFTPKLVIIEHPKDKYGYSMLLINTGNTGNISRLCNYIYFTYNNSIRNVHWNYNYVIWTDTTVQWHNTDSSTGQFNAPSYTYNYVAIG